MSAAGGPAPRQQLWAVQVNVAWLSADRAALHGSDPLVGRGAVIFFRVSENRRSPDHLLRFINVSVRQALWTSPASRCRARRRKRLIESAAVHSYPRESPIVHRNISPPLLDSLVVDDDDARVVLLFVRLRSLLFELCDHPVALCETCRRAYTPEQLGTEIGNRCYLCQCGADLRESLIAHARTCPNLVPQKPLARMAAITSSTIPPASERFGARRRSRLDAHAAVR